VIHHNSGKTSASALKCAKFLLNTRPPRPDTPFWIISEQYYQACSVCWKEKLCDQHFLPPCNVDWPRIQWYRPQLQWPFIVPLKPDVYGNNWMLEFKSFGQGRAAMQARSIGGFWFSEQFPWELFIETLRGCRDYMFPGGQFAEFTPVDPELCIAIERQLDHPPHGWRFYRLNVDENRQNLAGEWYDSFFASVPDEMMATRKTGALATFEGVIYQSFNPQVHVVSTADRDPDKRAIALKPWLPGVFHHRGIDWGASMEHPFVCTWACVDGTGEWLTYDEYWCNQQDKTTFDHAVEVVARSCAWGWPEPTFFRQVDADQSLPMDSTGGRNAQAMKKLRRAFVDSVRARVKELLLTGAFRPPTGDRGLGVFGDSFADPSRPGEINAFNEWGITTSMASNAIFKGIDCMRALLKINPNSYRARHYFDKRCVKLIEETRKYRWSKKRPNLLWTTSLPKPTPLKKDDDTCFPAGQTVDTPRGPIPIERILPGDPVFSHLGIATVVKNWTIKESKLVAVHLADGRRFVCTPDHKIGVAGGGWVEAENSLGITVDCRKGEPCKSSARTQDLGNESKSFNTAASRGDDIPMPRGHQTERISEGSSVATASSRLFGCTSKFGSTTTARSHPAKRSTTRTKTQPITTSAISSLQRQCSTARFTNPTFDWHSKPLPSGTQAMMATIGMLSTAGGAGTTKNCEPKSASNAASSIAQGTLATENSVPTSARARPGVMHRSIWLNGPASIAELYSPSIGTKRRKLARVNVQPLCVGRIERLSEVAPVYNLATTDGSFFVNGVLVSNCDADRYCIYSVELRNGLRPSSTTSSRDPDQMRRDVPLDRMGNGYRVKSNDAMASGFFKPMGK
jgi:hypothetical protein